MTPAQVFIEGVKALWRHTFDPPPPAAHQELLDQAAEAASQMSAAAADVQRQSVRLERNVDRFQMIVQGMRGETAKPKRAHHKGGKA